MNRTVEFRCKKCVFKKGLLLAVVTNGLLVIRKGDYAAVASLPAQVRCAGCGTWITITEKLEELAATAPDLPGVKLNPEK
jgi:hypothetical protein